MSQKTTRSFIKGTTKSADKKRPYQQIYKHFDKLDSLYYKQDGAYLCACDDMPARGYVIRSDGKETFMPHDFADSLISYEEARRMCKSAGVYLPLPSHPRHGYRTPPPLLIAKTPTKTRPMWNVDAIERHIRECQRRKPNARLH